MGTQSVSIAALTSHTMADAAALSLDEIIKAKKIKPFQKKAKVVKTTKGTKATVKRLGKNRPLKQGTAGLKKAVVKDARNKIIQKKKQKIGDARERLGELARQGDARERLNKIKKVTTGVASRIGPQGVAARLNTNKGVNLKKQGLQTAKNRQNVTGQTKMQGKNLTRTVATAGKAARNNAGGLKTAKNIIKPAVNRPAAKAQRPRNKQTVVVIKNDRAKLNQQRMKQMQVRENVRMQQAAYQPRYQTQGMRSDMVWETSPYPQERFYEPRPVMVQPRIQMAPAYRETIYVDQYGNEVDGPMRPRPVYMEAPRPRPAPQVRIKKQPMSANMAARLEKKQPKQQPRQQQRQQPKAQQGHKVLVTNLHPCVSGEDMEELFSTIGTIVTARMVREGVAEA